MYFYTMKALLLFFFVSGTLSLAGQENPWNNPVQTKTQLQVNELVQKKAEYHRLTNGVQDGYRIKLHFGSDRSAAEDVKEKSAARFADLPTYLDYQQPNFVVLAGDFKSRLEAFESLRKIQSDFPNAFIVKGKIKTD
jgi:hypothetical protein